MREGQTAAWSVEAKGCCGEGQVAGIRLDGPSGLALLENECDWLWESDAGHRICYLSASYFPATGIEPARILGRSRLERLLRTEGLDGGGSAHFDDLAGHRPFRNFVYELREGSPTCRWVSISGVPLFDADGDFLGYRGTGRNVTELISMARAGSDRA